VITSKQHEIGCQLVFTTNRKSHTGFDWYRHWPWTA